MRVRKEHTSESLRLPASLFRRWYNGRFVDQLEGAASGVERCLRWESKGDFIGVWGGPREGGLLFESGWDTAQLDSLLEEREWPRYSSCVATSSSLLNGLRDGCILVLSSIKLRMIWGVTWRPGLVLRNTSNMAISSPDMSGSSLRPSDRLLNRSTSASAGMTVSPASVKCEPGCLSKIFWSSIRTSFVVDRRLPAVACPRGK